VDEAFGAKRRDARQGARRGVVGSDEQQVQQVISGELEAGAQIGGRGARDVRSLHRDGRRQGGAAFEKHQCGHHLGDARNRALILRVVFPQDLARHRVVDDGGFGANIRHFAAELINAETRGLHFAQLAGASRGPGLGQLSAAVACAGRRIRRLLLFGGGGAGRSLGGFRSRSCRLCKRWRRRSNVRCANERHAHDQFREAV
jgi:hypothetical protein